MEYKDNFPKTPSVLEWYIREIAFQLKKQNEILERIEQSIRSID